ncbi:MAG: hypothetical protein ACK4KW_03755 [Gemmobacter sp.]
MSAAAAVLDRPAGTGRRAGYVPGVTVLSDAELDRLIRLLRHRTADGDPRARFMASALSRALAEAERRGTVRH